MWTALIDSGLDSLCISYARYFATVYFVTMFCLWKPQFSFVLLFRSSFNFLDTVTAVNFHSSQNFEWKGFHTLKPTLKVGLSVLKSNGCDFGFYEIVVLFVFPHLSDRHCFEFFCSQWFHHVSFLNTKLQRLWKLAVCLSGCSLLSTPSRTGLLVSLIAFLAESASESCTNVSHAACMSICRLVLNQ